MAFAFRGRGSCADARERRSVEESCKCESSEKIRHVQLARTLEAGRRIGGSGRRPLMLVHDGLGRCGSTVRGWFGSYTTVGMWGRDGQGACTRARESRADDAASCGCV